MFLSHGGQSTAEFASARRIFYYHSNHISGLGHHGDQWLSVRSEHYARRRVSNLGTKRNGGQLWI